jgi:CYTH domain-containing protein
MRALVSSQNTRYVLCFKSAGLLTREEIEISLCKKDFDRLASLAGHALIRKIRRVYQLPDGLKLEVNLVDEGLLSEFMYAEVEFESELQARSWDPGPLGLGSYLSDDVTEQPGQSMSAFWAKTRMNLARPENPFPTE